MTRDRCEIHRQFKAVDDAFRRGDFTGLEAALGNPPDFPNCLQPFDLGVGDYPLEYAIYWSPLPFIAELLERGADPNYPDRSGFPSLIAVLSAHRPDRDTVLRLLLEKGADPQQRGLNDLTPLHDAVTRRNLAAVEMLLEHGADPTIRTRIDDCSTPLEDAEAIGFRAAADLMRRVPARWREDLE